jgi:alkylated DNA repair dioxygenase AlkB
MQSLLFDHLSKDYSQNLLPENGTALYMPKVFDEISSANLMNILLESLAWEADQLIMFGKRITTRRKVAWVGDPNCSYTYSGVTKNPQTWTTELLEIKTKVEKISQIEFNSCLLNLYLDGNDGMGWHSDNEKELDPHAPIASLSLGAKRKFAFRHKVDGRTVSLFLEDGSALIMHTPTQEYWNHSLLKTKAVTDPRINLTFRKIIFR